MEPGNFNSFTKKGELHRVHLNVYFLKNSFMSFYVLKAIYGYDCNQSEKVQPPTLR
jgi:hypothetical protein